MASDYDATEFVDGDFQTHKSPYATVSASPAVMQRAPSRQEVDSRVAEAQQKLAELKRAQEQLERERAGLEETRRRQLEFQTGRQEMLQHLTRGVGLIQEAEFAARRDAEQMGKALEGLRGALTGIESIREETWTKDAFEVELTKALTAVENARMEWNSARLKFPVLSGVSQENVSVSTPAQTTASSFLSGHSFAELCRIGFALTWPLVVVAVAALAIFLMVLLRR